MTSNTFRHIATTTLALASILSASTAFAERDENRTTAWTIGEPVAAAPRDTGVVLKAKAAAPFEMSYSDQTGPTSIASSKATPRFKHWSHGTPVNPYDRNPVAGGGGGH